MKPKITNTYHENGQTKIIAYHIGHRLYREDGPAYQEFYDNGKLKCMSYWLNDKPHKIDGPAHIEFDLDGDITKEEYWIDGEEVTNETFENKQK